MLRRAPKPPRIERERLEQEALFRWRDLNVTRLPGVRWGFAVPNGAYLHGGKAQRAMQWAKLKRGGAREGVSDTFWPGCRCGYAGLWIEMKAAAPHNAPLTDEQEQWIAGMAELGYRAVVCCGWEAAAAELESYFGA